MTSENVDNLRRDAGKSLIQKYVRKQHKLLILPHQVNRRGGSRGRRAVAWLLLPLVALTLSAAPWAKTYRWTDDAGNVVYSQIPPQDGRPSRVIGAPPPPAQSPEEAGRRLREGLQRLEDRKEDRELQEEKAAAQRRKAGERRRNCQAARQNLQALERPSRALFHNPDGSVTRLTPAQREARMAEARERIRRDCPQAAGP